MQTAFDLPETLTAPIQAGQRLGEMTVSAGGETVLTVPIIAKPVWTRSDCLSCLFPLCAALQEML